MICNLNKVIKAELFDLDEDDFEQPWPAINLMENFVRAGFKMLPVVSFPKGNAHTLKYVLFSDPRKSLYIQE